MADKHLSTYRKKRDFEKTAEPSGEVAVAPSKRRRFVIQKHDATRLHYDLRLEFDGVFKSWAVTRGPSLDPHDKRLAVEVEDHPLDYGDFEGTIPKGQYGGGTVQLWDRGYWESPDPDKGFKKGDLKFTLDGEKLHGSWVLVRMRNDRNGGKRTNWLLIKHRDEYARDDKGDIILDEDKSVASGRAMSEIAAGKGKAPKPFMLAKNGRGKSDAVWNSNRGMAADTRAVHETRQPSGSKSSKASHVAAIPGFVAPQLCVSVEKPPEGGGWGHEIKLDGYRLQLRVEDGEVTLKTRKGLDWTEKFAAIARQAGSLPDALIDGEVVALDAKGDPDFSALQAALSDGKTGNLIFFAFDLLFVDEFDLRRSPLSERKQRLQDMLEGRTQRKESLIRYLLHVEAGGEAVWQTACKMSLEGIISKKLSAPYQSGRSENWTKTKCRAGHEVVLGGWKTTNGKFRSLMAGVYRGDHLAHVGIVGTGFGQDKVKRLMPALKAAASSQESVRRQERAEENQRCPLAEAGACRGDRICRLDRGRKCTPGGVQGAAAGQAGKRGDGGETSHDRDRKASSRASFSQDLQSEKGRRQIRCCHGGGHLQTRQTAVARRRRRQAGHKAGSRAIFRGSRRLDDRPYQGTAVLHRPRA